MSTIEIRLSAAQARAITDQIKAATEQLYALLCRAHEGQAWAALGYDSWRSYAMTEFGMSQSQAYRLLDHGRVIKEIEAHVVVKRDPETISSPIGEKDQLREAPPMPSESQARELAPLLDEPEKLRETWQRAVESTGGKPTATAVRQAREHVAPRLVPPVRPVPPPAPKPAQPSASPIPVEIVDAEIVEGDARRDAEEGQHWATETLMRWERDGADDDYTKVHKNLNTVTYIRADGRRVRKTASYSRPARADDSGEIVGMQMQTWWGMDRAGLFELRTEIAGQAARLDDVIHAIDQLIGAMDQHPTCKTAREAWEAAGHSVDEIELGEVAS